MLNKNIIILILILITNINCSGKEIPRFNGEVAYNYLKKQCEFGARVPGSEAHKRCGDYLYAELNKYADRVVRQPFSLPLRQGESQVAMTNFIANFNSDAQQRILLMAHWDTRPWADQDPDPANWSKPVLGANDGASGVAVLLEIARIMSITKPSYGVDILLVDGEDYGEYGDNESWAIGSREFARRKNPSYQPMYGILLDLIGDRDQQIYIESHSYRYARGIVDKVWNKAQELGIYEFIPEVRYEVMDDHVRLLEAGIPCIDIIDFDYPYWHTIQDTPDKCSAQSLENVGRVVLELLYE